MKEDNFTIIQNQYRLQTFKFKKTSFFTVKRLIDRFYLLKNVTAKY